LSLLKSISPNVEGKVAVSLQPGTTFVSFTLFLSKLEQIMTVESC
jgi:hypothetical protein